MFIEQPDIPRDKFSFIKPPIVRRMYDRPLNYYDSIKKLVAGNKTVIVLKNVKNIDDYLAYAARNNMTVCTVDTNDKYFEDGITEMRPMNGRLHKIKVTTLNNSVIRYAVEPTEYYVPMGPGQCIGGTCGPGG